MKTPSALKIIQDRLAALSPKTRIAALTTFYGLVFAVLVVALLLFSPFAFQQVAVQAPYPASRTAQATETARSTTQASGDFFAGDTWHAVTPSWPGILQFDGKTRAVRLEPLGADPIEATYSYDEERVSAELGVEVREGTLTMKNAAGQVSISKYRISDGKQLSLQFFAGQRPETYIKLTEAEAEQEKARIRAQVTAGTLSVPGIPQQPEVDLP